MKLIAFTGLPRSGKDAAAGYLVDVYHYQRAAFATPLKEAAAILLGCPLSRAEGWQGYDREAVMPEWGFSMRWFLQRLGTECLRDQIAKDFWIKRMRNSLSPNGAYVVTDCRFPNEVDLIHELGGTIIEIVRPGLAASAHVSDAGVKADWQVWNGEGVKELYGCIESVLASQPSNDDPANRP